MRRWRSVGSVPVSGLQCLVRDDIAGRANVTSFGHSERHLVLLPTSRRSVLREAIVGAEERTPPQHHSTGTTMKNLWRCRQHEVESGWNGSGVEQSEKEVFQEEKLL